MYAYKTKEPRASTRIAITAGGLDNPYTTKSRNERELSKTASNSALRQAIKIEPQFMQELLRRTVTLVLIFAGNNMSE